MKVNSSDKMLQVLKHLKWFVHTLKSVHNPYNVNREKNTRKW